MFTDMVGFTALMQENEQLAKDNRDRHRKVLESSINDYRGKILQYYGDGTLSIFLSAIEAVNCAVEIQTELQKKPKIPLRIGLHLGDIVHDQEGIYGDGVNLASRIESLSVPGAVLISGKVFDEIKNHPDIKTKTLGKFELKNVKQPVEVFAISCNGLVVPGWRDIKGKTGESIKSIAVLPFTNMSSDIENEYFSDGMTDEIINALTKVKGLQVTSRTSSFAFKGMNHDIREIGSKLGGVQSILEGSVRKAGNKVRVTAQLINTKDGYHLFSETYDRGLDDIFQVQDDIAMKIAEKLKDSLQDDVNQKVNLPIENLEAYNKFLKGKFYWNKGNPEDVRRAMNYFEKAIKDEPEFSLPYCALSNCLSYLGSCGQIAPKIAYSKAKENAIKALELDGDHAESHLSLAMIKFFQYWDWEGAKQSLKTAFDLNLDSATIHDVHGMLLIVTGKLEEAIEATKKAVERDPLSLNLIRNLGDAYFCAEEYDHALVQYEKALELDPSYRSALECKGLIYLSKGELEKAIKWLKKYKKLVVHPLKGFTTLGFAYGISGMKDDALACMDKLNQREAEEENLLLDIDKAVIYAGLENYDMVYHHLNVAYNNRLGITCIGMIHIITNPIFKGLRKDRRFVELLSKMGLKNRYPNIESS
ncbi:MAG: tetratricopeptide repeat protein, partial [Cyclobacteriaceae bacterium]|nr:tetratricopeptide repeat protein [Cyclobacteriaceae bacterium]